MPEALSPNAGRIGKAVEYLISSSCAGNSCSLEPWYRSPFRGSSPRDGRR